MRCWFLVMTMVGLTAVGCGTTRWSDTQRTATEQLLLSDATDRAVSRIDFSVLAGSRVYLDTSPIRMTVDSAYLTSSIRQHLLASDCTIKEKAEEADYVLEIRAGAMGTDRRDLLVGIPATSVPSVGATGTGPQVIPEIPIAKRTEQRAVAKVAVFAYDRETGKPVWQSGSVPIESKARDFWVLGAGPFQRGNIYSGTKFAGQTLPSLDLSKTPVHSSLPVTQEAIFADSRELLASKSQRRQAMQSPPPMGTQGQPIMPGAIQPSTNGFPAAGGVTQAGLMESQRTPPVQPQPQPQAVPAPPPVAAVPGAPQAAESMSPPVFQPHTAVPLTLPGSTTTSTTPNSHQLPSFRLPFLGN